MAPSYVGMRVRLTLNTGAILEGVVKEVDSTSGSIEVEGVTLNFKGTVRDLGPQRVSATKIFDLQFVTDENTNQSTIGGSSSQSYNGKPGTSKPIAISEKTDLKREKSVTTSPNQPTKLQRSSPSQPPRHYDVEGTIDFEEYQSPPPPAKAPQMYDKRKPFSTYSGGNGQVKAHRSQGFSRSKAKNRYAEDFDFQASLNRFDKEKIFAEIRQSDDVDPDTLLVSLNKVKKLQQSPSPTSTTSDPQRKLGHRENVLESSTPTEPSSEDTGTDGLISPVNELDESFEDPYRRRRESRHSFYAPPMAKRPSMVFVRPDFKTPSNVKVPCLTPTEYSLLESICLTDTGPSLEQLIEGGGRETATIVLQALGGSRRFTSRNHNAKPYVIVFCGNSTRVGAIGLAAARHLANHECRVDVLVLGSESDVTNSVAMQTKMLQHTGANRIKSDVTSLPSTSQASPDLVIDAILGADLSPSHIPDLLSRAAVNDAITWIANLSKSPVCSLECPSGLGGPNTHHGISSDAMVESIKARWTIAFGVPMSVLGSPRANDRSPGGSGSNLVGEVLLVDVGFPKAAFSRFVKKTSKTKQPSQDVKYVPCFNDKFIVGIELV
ncbi:hypothetical protein SeMB42_g06401 [Synchytrium endobioticum]|uniref:Enhancer of mRNA-decapping protein 3 n=1 Tax=Synchytrium endobioticum TaxID=286115 RepID=A0A507CI95_9FUNG|nr:hypothetical protein SeMB42_g06401 [Synchytrium endobioticum]TPX41916.1 hypothetical protein SeLEV6574_g05863 [Synchytrium endobioticum]